MHSKEYSEICEYCTSICTVLYIAKYITKVHVRVLCI